MQNYEEHITKRLDELDDRLLNLYLEAAKETLVDRPDDRIYACAVRVTKQLLESRKENV